MCISWRKSKYEERVRIGFVLNTLGYRAIAIAFIPFSLGAAFLFQTKLKRYLFGITLVLIAFSLFIPLHQSFNIGNAAQTRENYITDNFFLTHYDFTGSKFMVTDFWTGTYLSPKLDSYLYISPYIDNAKPDAILYTPQFDDSELGNYTSIDDVFQTQGFNLLYNDGFCCVLKS